MLYYSENKDLKVGDKHCTLEGEFTCVSFTLDVLHLLHIHYPPRGLIVCDPSTRAAEAEKSGAPFQFLFKIQTDREDLVICCAENEHLLGWTKLLKSAVKSLFVEQEFFSRNKFEYLNIFVTT